MGQLLRADLLPEAWIAPPPVRALRALLRHRVYLVRLRTRLRNRIHAIVADYGYYRPAGGYWTGPGRAWLAALDLLAVSRELVEDYLGLIDALQERIDRLDWEIRQRARSDPRVKVFTQLPGIGPFTALVILAEAGDISRFASARQLASWAGLTPTVRGSDRVAHYGHISKQGSVWLRWVLCEAAQTAKRSPQFAPLSSASRNGAERRSPPPPSPASCSPAPGACSPTPSTPQPRNPPRPRQRRGDRPRRGRLAPGQLADHPEPAPAALEDLTEQPGPRNTWSWSPPRRAAEWVDVRPLRRTHAPTLGSQHPPAHSKPQPGGLSSLTIISRRLRASSSFALARALTGATGCGCSSLTRGRAAARNQQLRGSPAQQPTPRLPGHRARTARAP